jgi:hypothetical protein
MKAELRKARAREPYEEKIRKVEQLVRLAKEFPRERQESTDKVDCCHKELKSGKVQESSKPS